ncbi:dihydroxyacetone kinase subunit L [Mesorhizobium sp. RP14(2022)]|uniref:Dihydroxyacetone kinase subunit L n=1 Tax=Mesorhizobium liriopis TaxID=2953882 RepID=A0ABT1CBS4_9HYPH|nr:DAK2 domain-containing protein [Mesorhizobium liriopis]MCO6052271.1 dihydroxyacetone kinase subunit L [Mesorhizobium liriopis]
MSITPSAIASVVERLHMAMDGIEQRLNEADAKLGDGDTGGMLARVLAKMAETDLSGAVDPGTALTALAKAATIATGSSLGTLLATGLMAAGRTIKGRESVRVGELSEMVAVARDAMIARGGASLGDKTVLDSLDAVADALKGATTSAQAAHAVAQGAATALEAFRSRPNRIGRARMFGDGTVGLDDPGMLAVKELAAKLAG